jgi:hypothetical protein
MVKTWSAGALILFARGSGNEHAPDHLLQPWRGLRFQEVTVASGLVDSHHLRGYGLQSQGRPSLMRPLAVLDVERPVLQ